jgi:predicted metalloprotease with PDZ domain
MNENSNNSQWPELYGFWIYGEGPTYVIYVDNDSISEKAGIRCGDRIIELDGNDVSNESAGRIKFIARNAKINPPPISVQSFIQSFDLKINKNLSNDGIYNLIGFTTKGDMPIIVDQINENSDAFINGGLRRGDLIVQVNNLNLKYSNQLDQLTSNDTFNIKFIPINRDNNTSSAKTETNQSIIKEDAKMKQAKDFYDIVI